MGESPYLVVIDGQPPRLRVAGSGLVPLVPVMVDGVIYPSLRVAAAVIDAKYMTIVRRLERGPTVYRGHDLRYPTVDEVRADLARLEGVVRERRAAHSDTIRRTITRAHERRLEIEQRRKEARRGRSKRSASRPQTSSLDAEVADLVRHLPRWPTLAPAILRAVADAYEPREGR